MVVIKNIEMPENCMECPCLNHENGECQITGNRDTYTMERPRSCPLTELRITKINSQEPCEDCISRQAVVEVMHEMWGDCGELLDAIMDIPPVTPRKPKTNNITIPKDATNGDVIKAIFPNKQFVSICSHRIYDFTTDNKIDCDLDWWKAPYQSEASE